VSEALRNEIAWMYEVPHGKTSVVYNGASPHRFDYFLDSGRVKRQSQREAASGRTSERSWTV